MNRRRPLLRLDNGRLEGVSFSDVINLCTALAADQVAGSCAATSVSLVEDHRKRDACGSA